MLSTPHQLLGTATALRASLVLSGFGRYLAWRPEVSTAANGILPIQEGLALWQQFSISPYSGSACQAPPLVLALWSGLVNSPALLALPNMLFDAAAALALRDLCMRLQRQDASARDCKAEMPLLQPTTLMAVYLLNPFSVMSSVSGSSSPLENLCCILALSCGCPGRGWAAAGAVAAAAYVGLHPLLLTLPVALLLHHGPEFTGTGASTESLHLEPIVEIFPGPEADAGVSKTTPPVGAPVDTSQSFTLPVEQSQLSPVPAQAEADMRQASAHVSSLSTSCRGRRSTDDRSMANTCISCTSCFSAVTRTVLCVSACLLLLGLASDVMLLSAGFPDSCCIPWPAALVSVTAGGSARHAPDITGYCSSAAGGRHQRTASPGGAACTSSCSSRDLGHASASARATSGGIGSSRSSCWAIQVYRLHVLLYDVTPNIGQFWYLFMELFVPYRPLFRFIALSLPVIMSLPLAVRFPRRPLLLFIAQVGMNTMFKPYPSVADLGLYLSLLPLLQPQLRRLTTGVLLASSLLMLCALGPAMLAQWLGTEVANSNFFYSVCLLFGVWQTVLIVQLLLLTGEVERDEQGVGGDMAVDASKDAELKGSRNACNEQLEHFSEEPQVEAQSAS